MATILKVKSGGTWVDVPAIVGPQGPQGPIGPTGSSGPTYASIAANATTITSNVTCEVDRLYVVDSALQLVCTLPAIAEEGAVIGIVGKGTGGFKVQLNGSSDIVSEGLSSGSGGHIICQQGTVILIRCFSQNYRWVVESVNLPIENNNGLKAGDYIKISRNNTITKGSVLFAGDNGEITQDNDNLFWNNALKQITVGNGFKLTNNGYKGEVYLTNPYYNRLNFAVEPSIGKSEVRFVTKGATEGGGQMYFVIASSEANDTGNNVLIGVASGRAFITNAVSYSYSGDLHIGGNSWETRGVLIVKGDGRVGVGTETPAGVFDVVSTTNGSLPFPRMTASQRAAISSPVVGTHVYQIDGTEGVYVYKYGGWTFAY